MSEAELIREEGDARPRLSPPPGEGEDQPERSRKRPRDSDFGDDDNPQDPDEHRSTKRRSESHVVLFRILVPSRQIGRVIGKEGSRIQKIREETRATIKIADAVSRHEERVIIISSRDDDSEVSYAESALYHIAKVILKDNDDGVEPSKVCAGHGAAANMIRLLITGSQAGCLIGVNGDCIANIRNSSGATVTILAQNQLPSYASAHVSDRLVQVSGDIPEILKALEKIGYKLRENPSKKVISIREAYDVSSARANPSYLALSSAEHVTSEMMISESLVGGLIGKQGYNISRIRNESGATIKVTGGRGEKDQRQILFGGSAQQVALAKELVEKCIYSQLTPQGGKKSPITGLPHNWRDSKSIALSGPIFCWCVIDVHDDLKEYSFYGESSHELVLKVKIANLKSRLLDQYHFHQP